MRSAMRVARIVPRIQCRPGEEREDSEHLITYLKENWFMNTSITQVPARIDAALQSPWQARAMAIVDAVVVNVIILLVGRVVTGELPVATVGSDDQPIGFAQVIMVTALAGLVAWALLALLERTTSRATAIWTAITVSAFALSLLGPIGSGVNASSKVVLACMHVGATATIIPLMWRSIAMRG